MAKSKANGSVPNRHLFSRLSYLHQAATFLGSQVGKTTEGPKSEHRALSQPEEKGGYSGAQNRPAADQSRLKLARHLLTDLRATSLKSQIRVSPAIKNTICKFCDTLLIEGETSISVVENKSKGGKKPWADVLVVKCNTCGRAKHFPVQAPRQKRRPQREQEPKDMSNTTKEHGPTNKNIDIAVKDV
ncbi:Rpr2-domain-containing protein [Xylariaceae sp. AK1471]|nr:Rpr2-domain-containing protein [Xylariaceae sp. AK1471]